MQLRDATVGIVGLGLMGGSLGLSLRGKCGAVIGVARRVEVGEQAVLSGVVDRAVSGLAEAASQTDIVVLATPVRNIIQSVPVASGAMRGGALLMDLGSTKREIVAAMNEIPEGVFAVGGHPMCGKETGGLESATPDLFKGATFVLTPTLRTGPEALGLAAELAESVGARPLVLDAERHDRAVALVSHLPYLLASSLVRAEEKASALDPAISQLAASGFRDTSRLAASQVEMMVDILLTNEGPVESALALFEEQLACVRELLRQPDALRAWVASAQSRRAEMFR